MSIVCDMFPAACAALDTVTGGAPAPAPVVPTDFSVTRDNDFISEAREPGLRSEPSQVRPVTNPTTLNTTVRPPLPGGPLSSLAKTLGTTETMAMVLIGIVGVSGYLMFTGKKGRR